MADGEAYQLKPNKKDPEAFERLFSASADEIFEAISRLEIINISLNYGDNPQLIFEGLNSTGLDLSEGDKSDNKVNTAARGEHHLPDEPWFSKEFRYCRTSRCQKHTG